MLYNHPLSDKALRAWVDTGLKSGAKPYLQPVNLQSCNAESAHPRGRLAGGWQAFSGLKLSLRWRRQSRPVEQQVLSYERAFLLQGFETLEGQLYALESDRDDFAGLDMSRGHLMGILNATPDSFSDGGSFDVFETAISHAEQMAQFGASFIDVGGESTRPGAEVVSVKEEQSRILGLIEALALKGLLVSVDTRNPETMREAVRAGAKIINDVTALEHMPESLSVAADLDVPVILMHMPSDPKTMQSNTSYEYVLFDIYDYLEARLSACLAQGMSKRNIAVDVGIGFGKTLEQNLLLLNNLSLFHSLGVPILLGASRKSFIQKVHADAHSAKRRLGGSLSALQYGVDHGVQMTRVHDAFDSYQFVLIRG